MKGNNLYLLVMLSICFQLIKGKYIQCLWTQTHVYLGFSWLKVFSHDMDGGFFASKGAIKSYNADKPDADLYSILGHIEKYRKEGVFHIRICYEELTQYNFPCNEWTQSSNFVEETEVTDFEKIQLTFDESSFGGLVIQPSSKHAVITSGGNWYYAIGAQFAMNWGIAGPGREINKVELYLAISKSEYNI